MSEATDLRAEALEAVIEFGTVAVLTNFASSYDAATRTNTRTPTSASIACTSPYTKRRQLRSGDSTQPAATAFVTIPAEGLDLVPDRGSRLVVGGKTWTINGVQTFEMQGVVIAYECGLEEGGSA